MTAPSWPRLAGWLATAGVDDGWASWRRVEDGVERAGTVVLRDGLQLVATSDGQPADLLHPLLQRVDWSWPDYTRAAGPPEACEHDGRPAWRVRLLPPPHKDGELELVVDEGLRTAVRAENAEAGVLVEVVDLHVGLPPDDVLAAVRAAHGDRDRLHALLSLVDDRPPPTPRWFPARSSYVPDDDCVVVHLPQWAECSLSRAPLGGTPVTGRTEPPESVVRLDAHGWSWAVAGPSPMGEDDARRVVDAAATGRPPA